MATYQENLILVRDGYLTELLAVMANPKPSYSIDGQSVDWNGYRAHLRGEIDALNLLIGDHFEIVTELY